MKKSEIAMNVELALQNDQEAIAILYNYTYPSMYSFIYRLCMDKYETEEILQESYIAAFSGLKKLRYKEQFWMWLRGIALNKWRSYVKENISEVSCVALDSFEDVSEEELGSTSLQTQIEDDIDKTDLWCKVNSLPENQRVCVILYYYDKMSVQDIAKALNIPVGSVKSRLHYARLKLKNVLDNDNLFASALPSSVMSGAVGNAELLAKILSALESEPARNVALAIGSSFFVKLGLIASAALVGTAAVIFIPNGRADLDLHFKQPSTQTTASEIHTTAEPVSTTTATVSTTSATSVAPSTTTTAAPLKTVTFDYGQADGGIVINKYTGTAEDVTVPSEINGRKVVSIGANAFKNCRILRSVDIPGSVGLIGDNAFCDCTSLTRVTLRNGITGIGDGAFLGCTSLSTIKIPSSVNKVGIYAFAYCNALKEAVISDGVEYINYCAFYKCGSLSRVTLPGSVVNIGNNAFAETDDGLIMRVYEGSYAHEYAGQNGFDIELL